MYIICANHKSISIYIELEVEEKLSAENVLDDQNAPLVVPKLLQLGSGIEVSFFPPFSFL